jgi:two-component system, chemotaxis family, sensor kinase CheA
VNGDYSKFLQTFFEEVTEHLYVLESGLLTLEQNPDDVEVLNRIFRSVHTIKGAGPIFGFTTMSRFAHKVETLLDPLRNRKCSATRQIIDLLLESADCLNMLVEAAKNGTVIDENKTVLDLEARLETCMTVTAPAPGQKPAPGPSSSAPAPPAPVTSARQTYQISWTPGEDLFQRGLNPLKLLEEMGRLGTVTSCVPATSRLPDLADLDPERCYLSWTCTLETDYPREDIESVFEFTAPPGGLTITALSSSSPVAQPTQEPDPEPASSVVGEEDDPQLAEVFFGKKSEHWLGAILVEQKAVTPVQLAKALDRQDSLRAKSKEQKAEASMRVDTEKVDKLVNLVGELAITQSMLSALGGHFEIKHLPILQERLLQLARNTQEIQERVMGIRMLPISAAFNRFPRLVRDLSAKVGKNIQLLISGEETELDRSVIESIGDPLTHLLRNACDHGLESTEERVAAGKPEQGTIRLNAFHEGGKICITVEDDGRGLNRDKILAKAIEQRMITDNDTLSDDQVWALIFRPGFSTAEKLTDLSGRGVGMDVVKRNIEELSGIVTIKTVTGRGTIFTLKLPLTLAIIEGMTIRVGEDKYIVPLLSILESIQPKADMVKTLIGKGEVVNVRGVFYPIVRLHEVFNLQPEHKNPAEAILLILETEGERVVVMVDEILGQQQVVIKSIEENFRKVDGVAGATILGDGTVGLILDVRGLAKLARQEQSIAV